MVPRLRGEVVLPRPSSSSGDFANPAWLQPAPGRCAVWGMQHYPQSMAHYVINKGKVVLQAGLSYRLTTLGRSLTRMDRCSGQMQSDSARPCACQTAKAQPQA
ncbi:hypothetical protein KIL84_005625 [Mauremys mutica]|uniref:Uncharacterized protein n=1 Tax=Mauremys mutica TaxID=74926 RepID=A0A9D3XI46_9SAUR|nr:hypothetical protein KIL84_005625 [Mauremys mutica]